MVEKTLRAYKVAIGVVALLLWAPVFSLIPIGAVFFAWSRIIDFDEYNTAEVAIASGFIYLFAAARLFLVRCGNQHIYVLFGLVTACVMATVGMAFFWCANELSARIPTDVIESNITSLMQSHYNGSRHIDNIQTHLSCCGTTGPKSWYLVALEQRQRADAVPDSCCTVVAAGCGLNWERHPETVHDDGCVEAIHGYMRLRKNAVCWPLIFISIYALVLEAVPMAVRKSMLKDSKHGDAVALS